MRVFLDQDVPHGIRRYLKERHEVVTAVFQGWDRIENGALLEAVEGAGFNVLITADQDDFLKYQNNFAHRNISLIVLGNGNWTTIKDYLSEIAAQVEASQPGKFAFIEMPKPPKRPYVRSDD